MRTYQPLKDKEIADRKEIEDSLQKEIKRLGKEIAALRIDLSKPPQERTYCKGCTLPRLTAALKDNERAEKVTHHPDKEEYNLSYLIGRQEGITDYRADILNEVVK